MAVALAYPESKQGKRDTATSVLNTEVSSAYLKHARFVLRNCRDKAIEVLRNAKYPLTVAYEEAQAIAAKQRAVFEFGLDQPAPLLLVQVSSSSLASS